MAATITVSDFAAAKGVTPQAVNKAIRTGRLTRAEDGGLDPVQASLDWERNKRRRGRKAGPAAGEAFSLFGEGVSDAGEAAADPDVTEAGRLLEGGGVPSFVHSQAVREAYRARAERLRYEQQVKELVKVETVRRVWHEQLRTLRDRLLLLPERLAPLLAAETDAGSLRRVLDAELRTTLEELTEEPPGV